MLGLRIWNASDVLSCDTSFMLVAFPEGLSYFKHWYKDTQRWGHAMLALGLLFGYFGFVA